MRTKLTLRVEHALTQYAKAFARKTGKSVSQIVSEYFVLLKRPPQGHSHSFTPLVRSLKGTLRGAGVDERAYRRYLDAKYR